MLIGVLDWHSLGLYILHNFRISQKLSEILFYKSTSFQFSWDYWGLGVPCEHNGIQGFRQSLAQQNWPGLVKGKKKGLGGKKWTLLLLSNVKFKHSFFRFGFSCLVTSSTNFKFARLLNECEKQSSLSKQIYWVFSLSEICFFVIEFMVESHCSIGEIELQAAKLSNMVKLHWRSSN